MGVLIQSFTGFSLWRACWTYLVGMFVCSFQIFIASADLTVATLPF